MQHLKNEGDNMKLWIFIVLSCLFVATPKIALSQEFSGRDHAHALLLLNQSDFDVRLGAKSLYRFGSNRADILDLAAEVTWTACSGKRKMDPDTLAWLAKALGNTKQPRYARLLDYCLSNPANDKAKKHVQLARANLEGEAANSFEGGKIDLQQVRARLTKKGNPTARNELINKFDALRRDQNPEEIYSTFGPPDNVSGISVPEGKAGFMMVKVRKSSDMLVLGYGGLGTVRFVYDENKTDWMLDEAKSDREIFWSSRDGHFITMNEQIAKGDGSQLRVIADLLIRKDSINKEVLDRVAERIYRSRQEKDGELADGLAWLCKVIAKSGDGRYKQLLLDVSDAAANKTLRKYAAKTAADLPQTSEAKYVPSLQ